MLRNAHIIALAAGLSLQAAILPDQFGKYQRSTQPAPATVEDRPVWDEFGLETAESAEYSGPAQKFTLTAFRFKDPTGAFAAFQWQRPANAQSGNTSAGTATGSLVQHANYLLRFEGAKPHPASLEFLYGHLPEIRRSSLPALFGYLPKKGRIPNSERYLLGPQSLARFEPRIPADLAAFDRGAEAQLAKYRSGGKEVQLTILSYPTPQMAIERTREFQKLAGALVKRSGPMVVVAPEAAGAAAVEKLAGEVVYSPSFTWNEYVSKDTPQDAAKMILAISTLAAGLIVASVLLGFMFGGSRTLLRRFGIETAHEEFTTLHLGGK